MLSFKTRLAAAVGAAFLVSAFMLPASSAMATGQSCATSGGPFYTCSYVNGTGLHINYMQGSVLNQRTSTWTNVHIELSGPRGLIQNCAQTNIAGGQTIYCRWSPNANEPAGNYCVDAWRLSSGTYVNMGHACLAVHS
jgi:hypothetical protein